MPDLSYLGKAMDDMAKKEVDGYHRALKSRDSRIKELEV